MGATPKYIKLKLTTRSKTNPMSMMRFKAKSGCVTGTSCCRMPNSKGVTVHVTSSMIATTKSLHQSGGA